MGFMGGREFEARSQSTISLNQFFTNNLLLACQINMFRLGSSLGINCQIRYTKQFRFTHYKYKVVTLTKSCSLAAPGAWHWTFLLFHVTDMSVRRIVECRQRKVRPGTVRNWTIVNPLQPCVIDFTSQSEIYCIDIYRSRQRTLLKILPPSLRGQWRKQNTLTRSYVYESDAYVTKDIKIRETLLPMTELQMTKCKYRVGLTKTLFINFISDRCHLN